jgi:Na+-transporting methylmalonyl-CoA/oxaloacetate decarboxylase gamma subunit
MFSQEVLNNFNSALWVTVKGMGGIFIFMFIFFILIQVIDKVFPKEVERKVDKDMD